MALKTTIPCTSACGKDSAVRQPRHDLPDDLAHQMRVTAHANDVCHPLCLRLRVGWCHTAVSLAQHLSIIVKIAGSNHDAALIGRQSTQVLQQASLARPAPHEFQIGIRGKEAGRNAVYAHLPGKREHLMLRCAIRVNKKLEPCLSADICKGGMRIGMLLDLEPRVINQRRAQHIALLRGVDRKEIERGQVLAKPGTIHPHTKFKAQVYVLTKDEGGRHTPFFNGYRPQFYFRTTDVTGVIQLPEGTEMCMPCDNVKMDVELITPIAIEAGLRFAIREGGRTVGAGVVSEIEG